MRKNLVLSTGAVVVTALTFHPFSSSRAQTLTTSTAPTSTATTTTTATRGARDPGVRAGTPAAGTPLAGLTPGQLAYFLEGKAAFEEIAVVRNPPPNGDAGLGPGFNSNSCVSCHAFPSTGGTSPKINPQVAAATADGARNRLPWFIKPDGPVLEARFKTVRGGAKDGGVHNLFSISGRSDAAGCNMPQEDFSDRSNISFRTATPVFGLGLIESIPESYLRSNLAANAIAKAALGISGKLNTNGNDGTTTRFGWKAQNKSLMIFAAEAYTVEMGVTNMIFPQERNETTACMFNNAEEDAFDFESGDIDDVLLFTAFMRFSGAPARGPVNASVTSGADLFTSTGCAACHTPSLTTGTSSVAALNQKSVPLYSDLAVHAMGPTLADGISQGNAGEDEFRTAPLWGLGQRIFFLHDGRTADLMEAIQAHLGDATRGTRDSEANVVIRRFNRLSTQQQQDILNFLRSL